MSVNTKYGSVLQPYLVGYMYNLEGPGTEAFLGNWISSPFVVPEILTDFVKLVFIEGSQPGDSPILVYIMSTSHSSQETMFRCEVSPGLNPVSKHIGWQVTGAYTNIDGGIPKKLLCHSHSALLTLEPPSSAASPISAQSSSFNLMTWDNLSEDHFSPSDSTFFNHDTGELRFKSVLYAHQPASPPPAEMSIPLGEFIPLAPAAYKKGISYTSKYFGLHFPAAWVIVLDACVKLQNVIYKEFGTAKSHDEFNSHATLFLSELEVLSGGVGQPIEKGIVCTMTGCTEFMCITGPKVQNLVTLERQFYKCSMKENAIAFVTKKSSLGGFALKDENLTPEQLKAWITTILGIRSHDEAVHSINFTRDAEANLFRHLAILSLIANRLIWTGKGSNIPIIDLFPEQYVTLPDVLVLSACAYIVCALHASFPGSSDTIHDSMVMMEECTQVQLLKHFRESSSTEIAGFELWLSTRDGAGGWRVCLERAIDLANKQKGPQPKPSM